MKPPAEQFLADAILSLSPTTIGFSIDGDKYSDIKFISECTLTQKQIEDEAKRLEIEYDAQEYARKRQEEYPSIAELTVALYDTSDKSALVAKRAAVKTKWPKNNTGPVE